MYLEIDKISLLIMKTIFTTIDNFIYMKMVECAEEIYTDLETKINFGEFTHDIFNFPKEMFIIIILT